MMMNQRKDTLKTSIHIFKDDSRCCYSCKTTTTTTPVTSMISKRTVLRLQLPVAVIVIATLLVITSTSNVNAFVVTTPLLNANGGAGASSAAAEQHYYSGGISSKIGSGIISTIASNPPSLQHPPSKQLLENSSAAARGGGRYGRRRSTENLLVLTNRLLKQEHDYHFGMHGPSPLVTSTTTVLDRVIDEDKIKAVDDSSTIVLPVPKTKPVPKFETQVQNVVVLPENAGEHDVDVNHAPHYTYSLEDSDPHQVVMREQLKYDALNKKVATPSLSKLMSTTAPVAPAQSQGTRLGALEPLGFESTTDDVLRYLKYYKSFGFFVDQGTAVVTDGTSFMGRELVLGLVKSSLSNVVVCTNDLEAARQVRSQIRKIYGKELSSKIYIQYMDLSDLRSIQNASHEIVDKFSSIDILCNNASVNLGDTSTEKTAQGLDYQMGINHVAHYYLTTQLLSYFSENARVVTTTSTAFRSVKPQHLKNSPLFSSSDDSSSHHYHDGTSTSNPYIHRHYSHGREHTQANMDPWKSYTQSKLANLLFAKELQQRLLSTDITSVAVHPGIMGLQKTEDDVYCGIDTMPSNTPEQGSSSTSASLLMESLCDTMTCKTPSQAAATILFGCLAAAGKKENESSLLKGGDLLVDCQSSNQDESSLLHNEQILYQTTCWKNTQTLIDQVLLSNQDDALKP